MFYPARGCATSAHAGCIIISRNWQRGLFSPLQAVEVHFPPLTCVSARSQQKSQGRFRPCSHPASCAKIWSEWKMVKGLLYWEGLYKACLYYFIISTFYCPFKITKVSRNVRRRCFIYLLSHSTTGLLHYQFPLLFDSEMDTRNFSHLWLKLQTLQLVFSYPVVPHKIPSSFQWKESHGRGSAGLVWFSDSLGAAGTHSRTGSSWRVAEDRSWDRRWEAPQRVGALLTGMSNGVWCTTVRAFSSQVLSSWNTGYTEGNVLEPHQLGRTEQMVIQAFRVYQQSIRKLVKRQILGSALDSDPAGLGWRPGRNLHFSSFSSCF